MKRSGPRKTRPKKRKKRSSRGRKILRGVFFAATLLTVSIACLGFYLSLEIDKRFSGRRWSIPSKVYSDTTFLYAGQDISKVALQRKLERLGYRNLDRNPNAKGEGRFTGDAWEVFLHDLETPYGKRQGFPLQLTFKGNRIHSLRDLKRGKALSFLEIEPELLMLFFGSKREQRRLVSIKEIPPHLIHAVLAAEDSRFYEHFGVDLLGILRALKVNLRHGHIRQGGSTITQQLAKSYFLTPERTFSRKLKEAFLALTMEQIYEKDDILEIYLNEIYLGQKESVSINGIGEASHFYFGKPASRLTTAEAATLAGLIRGPNLFSPYADPARSTDRRNSVLRAMNKQGWISEREMEEAISKPVKPSGYDVYRRQAPYFADYVSSQLASIYPPEALSSLGLSIYTTLDTEVQRVAEVALEKGLKRIPSSGGGPDPGATPQGAILVMQPKTGYILAMVGGRDYGESQFNRLTQARRQPGSAFKPFVFLSALDRFTPATRLSNEARTYDDGQGKEWHPRNYSPVAEREVAMRTALARSINLPTVDLAMKVGLDRVANTARTFGFSSSLRPYPSLALGASEVVPIELARAYCAFAAEGTLPHPVSVKDVTDEGGAVLERRYTTVESVTTPAKAFLITSMLQSAVEEGTGRTLKTLGIDFPVAGKTGTTNELKDAWFIGYTPELLALVWVGYDQGQSLPGSGSEIALPIWAELMGGVRHSLSGAGFTVPPGVVRKEICLESGGIALSSRCTQRRSEFFLDENTPKEHCTVHGTLNPLDRIIKGVKERLRNF